MILSASTSFYSGDTLINSQSVSGNSASSTRLPENSGQLKTNISQLESSVRVSLSTDSGSFGSNTADPFTPVYSRPGRIVSAQVASSSVASSSDGAATRPEQASDKNALNKNADTEKEQQTSKQATNSATSLTEQEMQIVDKLQARDREVRAHEQAHKSVGGQYAGAISFSYQSGPDGRRYAVGGEVPIDVSPIPGDPQATIAKMTIVKAAATAPAQPSAQDIMVAAEASRILMEAQNELVLQNNEKIAKDSTSENEPQSSDIPGSNMGNQNSNGKSGVEIQADVFQRISSLSSEIESQVDILI